MRSKNKAEVSGLQAQLRREQLKVQSLEKSLDQKVSSTDGWMGFICREEEVECEIRFPNLLFYRRRRLKSSPNSAMSSSPKSRRAELICKYYIFS